MVVGSTPIGSSMLKALFLALISAVTQDQFTELADKHQARVKITLDKNQGWCGRAVVKGKVWKYTNSPIIRSDINSTKTELIDDLYRMMEAGTK